jgi:cytochrome c oxidase cbb3-type subunit 3
LTRFLIIPFIVVTALISACSSSEAPLVELLLDENQVSTIYQSVDFMSTEDLQGDSNSMDLAHWLFSENCSSCHQADAKGQRGVPDLTDQYWLFEGSEEAISHSITSGRLGVMPQFGGDIGEVELGLLVTYVESLATAEVLNSNETAGKVIYEEFCTTCHAIDGTGVANLGPNLTDEYWQWGGNMITIRQSVTAGRTAECPAQEEVLSPQQIQLLTAYVLNLGPA